MRITMKYYRRVITRRVPVNDFGKLGYVPYVEYVKTDDIDRFNYRKVKKYTETNEPAAYLMCEMPDRVYARKIGY